MEDIARYDKIDGTASQCNNIQGKQPDLCASVMPTPTNMKTTKEDHERMSSEVGTNALLKQTKEHSICGTSFILQDAIVSFFTSTFAFRLSLGRCRYVQLHEPWFLTPHLSCRCYHEAACCAIGWAGWYQYKDKGVPSYFLDMPRMPLSLRLLHPMCTSEADNLKGAYGTCTNLKHLYDL